MIMVSSGPKLVKVWFHRKKPIKMHSYVVVLWDWHEYCLFSCVEKCLNPETQ